jgi:amidase
VPSELIERSAVDLAYAIAARELSSREVVQAHLDRIAEVNDRVNAIVAMFDPEAILAEADLRDAGGPIGPLHGLPVAVKDLEDVAGLPTREGSIVTSDAPANADGFMAERLRAAGAVIVGKTNTPEFGTGSHTFNEVYGATRNPWNLERSAGGSSGGAAAALAARMLPIADGSDLGGSLRNPASFCNVVGLRPSIGRVAAPVDASTHLLRLSVKGPMARTVADAGLLLAALAGPDVRDPLSLDDDPRQFAAPLGGSTGPRVAWAGTMGLFPCDAEVLEICGSAAGRFADAGGTVVDAVPDLSGSMDVFRTLRGLGYLDLARDLTPEQLEQTKASVQENVAFGRALTVDDVLDAERDRARIHRTMVDFFTHHDVVALPSAQVAPFPVEIEYPHEIAGVAMADYLEWMTACCVITPTGCPAISIPAGFTSDGLPVGLQLVAAIGRERALLEAAAALETVIPHHLRSPDL